MARTVFFSFHYQRDIMRVQIVKNHYVTKGNYATAGFFDGSLEEKAKKDGDGAVKKLINDGLTGSSVTCVLIGQETFLRRWVYYEILKSVELGMGVFGIRIHQIPDARSAKTILDVKSGKDTQGPSPFEFSGYGTSGSDLQPMIKYTQGWQNAPYLQKISRSAAPYLPSSGSPVLSNLFTVYDWENHDGFNNFKNWVEAAAKQAGR